MRLSMTQLDLYIARHGKNNGPVRFFSKMQVARAGQHGDLGFALADLARHRRLVASLPHDKTARAARAKHRRPTAPTGMPVIDL